MKQKAFFLSFIAFSFLLSFTACKKEASSVDNTDEVSAQSDDQLSFSSETDALLPMMQT